MKKLYLKIGFYAIVSATEECGPLKQEWAQAGPDRSPWTL
jgi:hypothetical protein